MSTKTQQTSTLREVTQAVESLDLQILRLQRERDRLHRREAALTAKARPWHRHLWPRPSPSDPKQVITLRTQAEWDAVAGRTFPQYTEIRIEGALDRITATPANTEIRLCSGAEVRLVDDGGKETIDCLHIERGSRVGTVAGAAKIAFVRGQVDQVRENAYLRVVGLTGRVQLVTGSAIVGELFGTIERVEGIALIRNQVRSGVVGTLTEHSEIRHAHGRIRELSGDANIKVLESTATVLSRTGGTIEQEIGSSEDLTPARNGRAVSPAEIASVEIEQTPTVEEHTPVLTRCCA